MCLNIRFIIRFRAFFAFRKSDLISRLQYRTGYAEKYTFMICQMYHGSLQTTKVDKIEATKVFNCLLAFDSRLLFVGNPTWTFSASFLNPYLANGSAKAFVRSLAILFITIILDLEGRVFPRDELVLALKTFFFAFFSLFLTLIIIMP